MEKEDLYNNNFIESELLKLENDDKTYEDKD